MTTINKTRLTKKRALKIYAAVFPDDAGVVENASGTRRDSIIFEIRAVINAKTESEAMKAIEWWGWESGMTCLQAVKRIRKRAKDLVSNRTEAI